MTVPARRLLSDCLRHDLGLTGTHVGCEHGVCGACTVLVGGVPMRSCLLLAVSMDGEQITTVEGLAAADGALSPVQQAFADCHGLQCGFCTPGFLTTITAGLAENPDPTPEQAREMIGGNLCRCTGYQNIVAAVLRAAELSRRTGCVVTRMMGEPVRRVEDRRLLTGNGRYLDDLGADAVEVAVLRSPHAHAKILDIDVTGALEVEGLLAIYTYEDLTGPLADPLPLLIPHPALTHGRTQYPLARDEVNYVGEAVALVVAENRYLAEDAAERIAVSYGCCRRWSASTPPGPPSSWCTTTCRATWPPTWCRRWATPPPRSPPRRTGWSWT